MPDLLKISQRPYLIMGWREWVALPELGIEAIKAKVDTGARTSALHAFDVRIVRRGDQRFARFKVHPVQRDSLSTAESRAPLVDRRPVKNSSGEQELRPVILATIQVLGLSWPIEITLTRRDVMGFRMLLGRQALRGRAMVDPGSSFLVSQKPRRARRRATTLSGR
jgi:hypothetical protein